VFSLSWRSFYWVVISRPSFASQNRTIKELGREFTLHKPSQHMCHLLIVRPWPTVKPNEKRSFLTLTHFFDAKTQFSGRMDGTIRFALLSCVGIKYSFFKWNEILSHPHAMKWRVLKNEHFSLIFAPPYLL
jgi:hypothetical protein